MKTIKLNDLDWYIIDEDDETQTLLLADVLSEDILEDIVDDKRYIVNDGFIIYNNDFFDDTWENSYIRRILNTEFKVKYLEGINLEGEVRLLTKEEVNNMPYKLKDTCKAYWTMTPDKNYGNGKLPSIRYANACGDIGTAWVTSSYGVRPVINIKKDKVSMENIVKKLDQILDELEELKKEV